MSVPMHDRPPLSIHRDPLEDVLRALDEGEIPEVEWETALRLMTWEQGEHIGIIGPTGQGKTTLALALLKERQYVTVFGTKPVDETLERFAKEEGYTKHEKWPTHLRATPSRWPGTKHSAKRILWPDARKLDSVGHQRTAFNEAMEHIYLQGSWTLYMDELWYAAQHLGMAKEVKTYLMQGRSIDLSLVMASQRPAWIPVEVYDQSTHLFFSRDNDEANLRRISGVGYLSSAQIRQTIPRLRQHQFLYINTRDGVMAKTVAPLKAKGR